MILCQLLRRLHIAVNKLKVTSWTVQVQFDAQAVFEDVHVDGLCCQEVIHLDDIGGLTEAPSAADGLLVALVEGMLTLFVEWRYEHDVVSTREVAKILLALLLVRHLKKLTYCPAAHALPALSIKTVTLGRPILSFAPSLNSCIILSSRLASFGSPVIVENVMSLP